MTIRISDLFNGARRWLAPLLHPNTAAGAEPEWQPAPGSLDAFLLDHVPCILVGDSVALRIDKGDDEPFSMSAACSLCGTRAALALTSDPDSVKCLDDFERCVGSRHADVFTRSDGSVDVARILLLRARLMRLMLVARNDYLVRAQAMTLPRYSLAVRFAALAVNQMLDKKAFPASEVTRPMNTGSGDDYTPLLPWFDTFLKRLDDSPPDTQADLARDLALAVALYAVAPSVVLYGRVLHALPEDGAPYVRLFAAYTSEDVDLVVAESLDKAQKWLLDPRVKGAVAAAAMQIIRQPVTQMDELKGAVINTFGAGGTTKH